MSLLLATIKNRDTQMDEDFQPSENLANFRVCPRDPGFLYVIRAYDLIKIGKTKAPEDRMKAARTWLPDIDAFAFKPFWDHSFLERYLQIGLTSFWYSGEWYKFSGDSFEEYFVTEFQAFDNQDINKNSIDFIYFMNSLGMSELTIEFGNRSTTKPKFQKASTIHHKEEKK